MANIKECEHAGIGPNIVERFENRISRLLRDMDKHGLSLFCGRSGSIRFVDDFDKRALIVGMFLGGNHDGGCGAVSYDNDGLLRGE